MPEPAHSRMEYGTPRTAAIFAIVFVCGIGVQRLPEERWEKVLARQQHPEVFPRSPGPAGFSSLLVARDPPEQESGRALGPLRCLHAWISSACFPCRFAAAD